MGRVSKITCSYENCSATFSRSDRYKYHLRVHTGERPFVCPYDDCNNSYTSACCLKYHEETHQSPSIRCPVNGCTLIFTTKKNLKRHIDKIHNKIRKTYKCSECEKEYPKRYWLMIHQNTHTNILPYLCTKTDCGKRFLTPSKLKRHMKIHEGYSCEKPDCGKVFPNWSLLVKHVKVSHAPVHKCPVCEKEFSRSSYLAEHQITHTSERPIFACSAPNCKRYYFAKRNLNAHVKSYHDARPYKCPENCPKEFKTEEDLIDHKRYHDPTIPFTKKRKRKNLAPPKPTFAARLAGCVERKTRKKSELTSNELEDPSPTLCSDTTMPPNNSDNADDSRSDLSDMKSRSCDDADLSALDILESILSGVVYPNSNQGDLSETSTRCAIDLETGYLS